MRKPERVFFGLLIVVSLLAFASGCATIKLPIGQENVRVPDLSPPVCFHSLPLESFFGKKDISGIRANLSPDWVTRQGFSKIGKKVVRRTTFPVAVNGQWGWFVGDKEKFLPGEILIPGVPLESLIPSDVYLLTGSANDFLKIGREEIDWGNPIDFSPKNSDGRENLSPLLSRFAAVEDGSVATNLGEGDFVNARKASNFLRRLGGSAPTISTALIVPVSWPFYLGNWVVNLGMTEGHLGGTHTASTQEIREYLKNVPETDETIQILEALEALEKENSHEKKSDDVGASTQLNLQ